MMTKSVFVKEMYKKQKEITRVEQVSKKSFEFRKFLSDITDGLEVMLNLMGEGIEVFRLSNGEFKISNVQEPFNNRTWASYKPTHSIRCIRHKRHMYVLQVDFEISNTTRYLISNHQRPIAEISAVQQSQTSSFLSQYVTIYPNITIVFPRFDAAVYNHDFSNIIVSLINDLVEKIKK